MEAAPFQQQPDIRASFRRAGDERDLYRLRMDGSVLRIEARGHWDLMVAKSYARDVTRIVTDIKRTRPHLRAIVDRTELPAFDEGVPEILMATYNSVLREGDRVAMLVDSSVTKGKIRQVAGREETRSFLSTSAAKTWLLAYG